MKCWKCGQELVGGSSTCVYCNASMDRTLPKTEIGRAMRQVYDQCGCDVIFKDLRILANGLNDMAEDTEKISRHILAMNSVHLGDIYQRQLQTFGKNDKTFNDKVFHILTHDVDMSDKAAKAMIGYFDEMIGWRTETQEVNQVERKSQQDDSPRQSDAERQKENARDERMVQRNNDNETRKTQTEKNKGKQTSKAALIGIVLIIIAAVIYVSESDQNRTSTTTSKMTATPTLKIASTVTPTTKPTTKTTKGSTVTSRPTVKSNDAHSGTLLYENLLGCWYLVIDGNEISISTNSKNDTAKELEKVGITVDSDGYAWSPNMVFLGGVVDYFHIKEDGEITIHFEFSKSKKEEVVDVYTKLYNMMLNFYGRVDEAFWRTPSLEFNYESTTILPEQLIGKVWNIQTTPNSGSTYCCYRYGDSRISLYVRPNGYDIFMVVK